MQCTRHRVYQGFSQRQLINELLETAEAIANSHCSQRHAALVVPAAAGALSCQSRIDDEVGIPQRAARYETLQQAPIQTETPSRHASSRRLPSFSDEMEHRY